MKLSNARLTMTLLFVGSLLGCSPHPSTGVWKALADNEMGIDRLVVSFEGRAEFVSKKLDNATWHCFWAKESQKKLNLKCSASTSPDDKKTFFIVVNDKGLAEFMNEDKILATFTRLDENPSPKN